jgi:hypothetical protein
MNQYPTRNVLYLDSDAVVMGDLGYLNTVECDIGCHIFERMNSAHEKLAGTIFLKNTINTRSFVAKWYSNIVNAGDCLGEFHSFDSTLREEQERLQLSFLNLPPEYAKIFDAGEQAGVIPLIQHNQASRRNKKIINSN